jgi:hypothetical protein
MTNIIQFLNHADKEVIKPIPAQKLLPEWYVKTFSYQNNNKLYRYIDGAKQTTATIKKCMPVFDVLSSGYFILTHEDIFITKENGGTSFDGLDSFSSHPRAQANLHPAVKEADEIVVKFLHPWGIKTPVGYSCLFIPPVHRKNVINILPGLVDTDTYNLPVQFPFVLGDENFEGIIPAGTPIAQVIPFKRNDWKAEYGQVDQSEKNKTFEYLNRTLFNAYKNRFWAKKDYL